MANLTETAFYTRRTVVWVILGVISYILLRIFWGIFVILWLAVFPPKATPPNHAFHKLPHVAFPAQASGSDQLTFQLETIEGRVPLASASASVYFMPKAAANLLALTQTQEFAERLQFDPTPVQESKNIYRFNDADLALRRLRYDIVSNNFVARYAFERDPGLFTEHDVPSADAAKLEAQSMLETFNLYNEDIENGTHTSTFLKLSGDRLISTTSLSQSDAVRVDFFRQRVGGVPVFTDNPDEGNVSIIFSGAKDSKKHVLQFAYTFWPIDYQTSGTYELKSSDQAWQELQNGQGYIARYPKVGTTAVVRNVYLGYYDSFEPQTYLQPIFVFEGDNGFLGYVPAISPEWIE